jgi:hypothetical protein
MGSSSNRLRKKWQDYGGRNAGNAENSFYNTFKIIFDETEYEIKRSPNEFRDLYVNVKLSPKEISEIYTPEVEITKHGVVPDYSITNKITKKTIYIEVKRQDGWVEGKTRSAGRGNAHERSCKYFTPGLQNKLRKQGNLDKNILPFWIVYIGDITRDPCRVREVKFWFEGVSDHYFMWRDTTNSVPIIEHFLTKIKPLID